MLFESELPEDFQSALDAWRGYVAVRKDGGSSPAPDEEE
jgi:hypothetical protein